MNSTKRMCFISANGKVKVRFFQNPDNEAFDISYAPSEVINMNGVSWRTHVPYHEVITILVDLVRRGYSLINE